MFVYRDAEIASKAKEEAEDKRIEEMLKDVPEAPKWVTLEDWKKAVQELPKLVEELKPSRKLSE